MTATPNRYPGNCHRCGGRVEAGAGRLDGKGDDGRWRTVHTACPTEAPEAPVQPASTVPTFTPTAEQMECVKLFATYSDLVIQAAAGAGKSSTLLLLAHHALANGRRGQYCAFNSAIVKDIAAKVPGNVNASTMHSLAFRAVGYRFAHRLNAPRQRADETARLLGLDPFVIGSDAGPRTLAVGFLASLVMGAVRRFTSSADPEIGRQHFEYRDGLDSPDEAGNRRYENNDAVAAYLLPFARKAWADLCDPDGRLKYSHDCYLKLWSMSDPRIDADFVMLDEAQDADPVQVEIIKHQRRYGTQVVVVGDNCQVLYEWRGAVNALADFEAMGANIAYLTQSFRFGDAVAEVANGLLGRLDAKLRVRGFGQVASTVGPVAEPEAVLTRSNAGAVRIVLSEMDRGRRTHLVGGSAEVVGFCKAALDLQNGRPTTHPELACFDSWMAVQQYVVDDDQGEDLRLMVKLIDEFGAQRIIDALERQPREPDADLVVSTCHKSKGREWDRVQLGGDFKPPREPGKDLSPAELRLLYVAVTRARRELDITAVAHAEPGWKPRP